MISGRHVVLALDQNVMTEGAIGAGLKLGELVRIGHEGVGGFLRGPFDDDAKGGELTVAFEGLMIGRAREILAAVFGHERIGGWNIVSDPRFSDGSYGENGVSGHS